MTNNRRLGKSEMNVSPLSFGASALGGVFGVADESESIRTVHAALDHGINYYDVAPAYGATRSEEVLGKALTGVPRDCYYLSTKAGKYATAESGGKDYFDYSESTIRKSLDESMDRLGVDFLDIVHLHDFEYQGRKHVEWAFDEGFNTLAALKREGRIGAVGAGIYPMDLWSRVVEEAPVDTILVHNHYNLNDTSLVDLLPVCREKDIGVISASPFASGLLSGGMIADWHPADAHDKEVLQSAARFCTDQGASIAQMAFQFSSQNSEISTTMFSTTRESSLLQNLERYQQPYDQDLLSQVLAILEPIRNKQWDYDCVENESP